MKRVFRSRGEKSAAFYSKQQSILKWNCYDCLLNEGKRKDV